MDGRQQDGPAQRGGRHGEPAFHEDAPQPFQGAGNAFLGRLFTEAEPFADLAGRLALEIAQEKGVAVGFVEAAEGVIEVRGDLFPDGFGGGSMHGGRFVFPGAAADFRPDRLGREVLGDAVQPTGEHRAVL